MAKHIQAYFNSEDQAEGAKTSLLSFETEHVEVGRLEQSIGRDSSILVPFVPVNNSATGGTYGAVGYPGAAGGQGVIPVGAPNSSLSDENVDGMQSARGRERQEADSVVDWNDFGDEDYESLQYVLSVKLQEKDYDAAVHKLRSQGAFVAQLDE
ncbi:hypothetical protein [Paenibacillus lentus]|uniref:Uncharacterized protein n=1 Tax=Paenibacillus lentus TaxID=1338368 RepID=A0A3Q8SAY4_9BACL|nr:hypothetical protein [Paenibacillus lentus]AZK46549.1 hypothetical protein EIM92_10620 [Paenibacillus lentus]